MMMYRDWSTSSPLNEMQRSDLMASYVSPAIRDKFETLSVDLKNIILERNVQLNTMYDLISVLEQIVAEAEE